MFIRSELFLFFFFNDTATTEIYTLSLHDALPIFPRREQELEGEDEIEHLQVVRVLALPGRSEEYTSELQSQSNLVCRLLLEKKKIHMTSMPSSLRTLARVNTQSSLMTSSTRCLVS